MLFIIIKKNIKVDHSVKYRLSVLIRRYPNDRITVNFDRKIQFFDFLIINFENYIVTMNLW